ncbi:transposase domain-containing protein [Streptomyces sp. NBC_01431]|uniref:transposase domain-containing protein n=1 Tax=Streptomyces sp. NBC_01431 TaxID=2903863 RepID=UPI003FCEA221
MTAGARLAAGRPGGAWAPRPGQAEPATDERLWDRITVGLLTRTFPPESVDRVVAQCGRGGRRNRLPPRVVVYLVLVSGLSSTALRWLNVSTEYSPW